MATGKTSTLTQKKETKLIKFFELLGAIALCQLAGLIGSFFSIESIPTWYSGLDKPFYNPPNWLFGPVWTILYALMGVSLYLIWQKRDTGKDLRPALEWFFIQLIANTAWSISFFGQEDVLLSFGIIAFMIPAVMLTIKKFLAISRVAAWLLVPYLCWIIYAALLNLSILFLN
jgi:tryptophan-rich sensory protein